jgi:transketolase
MMENNIKFNAKMFSMFGMNGAIFGSVIPFYHDTYKYKVLTSDMGHGAGLTRYAQNYPDDFINVGIAEQNLVGIAAGLSSEGFKCIAVAQACFISMRSFEQIRQYFGYMKNKAIIVGINSGFALTYFGNTHYCIEDISLMRSIPGMVVLSPADAGEAVKAFEAAFTIDAPVYIRLSGTTNTPIVYSEDFDYDINSANIVFDKGNDITIFATGTMVYYSIEAAKMLNNDGVSVKVLDVHTIKPIDRKSILQARTSNLIVSVEEHTIIGGLGGAISEVLSEEGNMPRLLRIGIEDKFSSVGDYNYLLEQNGLTVNRIVESIKQVL